METFIIIFVILVLAVCLYAYLDEKKQEDELNRMHEEAALLHAASEREAEIRNQKIKETNKSISSCTCDNIFNFSHPKKGFHNYSDEIVGVYYANITIEKTLDCYVKLVQTEYDNTGYGIAVYSMNDVQLGWLPANSTLKSKLTRIMTADNIYYGYAMLNQGNNIKSRIKLRLPNEVMIND